MNLYIYGAIAVFVFVVLEEEDQPTFNKNWKRDLYSIGMVLIWPAVLGVLLHFIVKKVKAIPESTTKETPPHPSDSESSRP